MHNSDRGVVSRGSHLHNRGWGVVSRGGVDNRGSMDDWGSVVDGVGHNRGSVGNCVVSHDGGSVHSVVGKRGGVHKRGGVVDGMRDDWGSVCNSVVGHGMVGNGDMGGVTEHDVLGGREELGSGRGRSHKGKDGKGLEKSRIKAKV